VHIPSSQPRQPTSVITQYADGPLCTVSSTHGLDASSTVRRGLVLPASAQAVTLGEPLASPSELVASLSELLTSPSELLTSPSELSASPSEPLASPSEL
jgi:hypothetical protein